MKKLASLLVLSLATLALPTMAAEPSAQQTKMKTCNADAKAKDLKGDERKAFMSSCLKG